MGVWNLYTEESGGGWTSEAVEIPRPQEDINLGLVSNQQTVQLADGSLGYYTPETKSTKQEIQFAWFMRDDTFRTTLQSYIDNHDYIKIVTHISGFEFIGRFKSVMSRWLTGQNPDEFEIIAIFERMSGD